MHTDLAAAASQARVVFSQSRAAAQSSRALRSCVTSIAPYSLRSVSVAPSLGKICLIFPGNELTRENGCRKQVMSKSVATLCDIDCAIFLAVNVHFEIRWSKGSYFICRELLGSQCIQLGRRRTVHAACGALIEACCGDRI